MRTNLTTGHLRRHGPARIRTDLALRPRVSRPGKIWTSAFEPTAVIESLRYGSGLRDEQVTSRTSILLNPSCDYFRAAAQSD
jgi:hypothetical protein